MNVISSEVDTKEEQMILPSRRKRPTKLLIKLLVSINLSLIGFHLASVECLKNRYGSFTVISAKPCQNALGQVGTCMFMWDCIKSEGQHLGTCSDTFLFGSCCYHNSTINDIDIQRPNMTTGSSATSEPTNSGQTNVIETKQQSVSTMNSFLQQPITSNASHPPTGSQSTLASSSYHRPVFQSPIEHNQESKPLLTHQWNQFAAGSLTEKTEWPQSHNSPDRLSASSSSSTSTTTTTTSTPAPTATIPTAIAPMASSSSDEMKPAYVVMLPTRAPSRLPPAQQAGLDQQQQVPIQMPMTPTQRPQGSWFSRPASLIANAILHSFKPFPNYLNPNRHRPTYSFLSAYRPQNPFKPTGLIGQQQSQQQHQQAQFQQLRPNVWTSHQDSGTLDDSSKFNTTSAGATSGEHVDSASSNKDYHIVNPGDEQQQTTTPSAVLPESPDTTEGISKPSQEHQLSHHHYEIVNSSNQTFSSLVNQQSSSNQTTEIAYNPSIQFGGQQSSNPIIYSSSSSSTSNNNSTLVKQQAGSSVADSLSPSSQSGSGGSSLSHQGSSGSSSNIINYLDNSRRPPTSVISQFAQNNESGSHSNYPLISNYPLQPVTSQNSVYSYGNSNQQQQAVPVNQQDLVTSEPSNFAASSETSISVGEIPGLFQYNSSSGQLENSIQHQQQHQQQPDGHRGESGLSSTIGGRPFVTSSAGNGNTADGSVSQVHEISGMVTTSPNTIVTGISSSLALISNNHPHPIPNQATNPPNALASSQTGGLPVAFAIGSQGKPPQSSTILVQQDGGSSSAFLSTSAPPKLATLTHSAGHHQFDPISTSVAQEVAQEPAAGLSSSPLLSTSQQLPGESSQAQLQPQQQIATNSLQKPSESLSEALSGIAINAAPATTTTTTTSSTTTAAPATSSQQQQHHHQHHQPSRQPSSNFAGSSAANKDVTCGVKALYPKTKVVGGRAATFGAWPWQVSVRRSSLFGFSSTHRCGGAVINSEWIATAGHCVEDLKTETIRIRVGELDFSTMSEPFPYIERSARRAIVHPKYNVNTYENDLALVQLDQPIQFAPHISPICLPPDNVDLSGRDATVTGWGRLQDGGVLPTTLQEVQVPIVSNDKCKDMFQVAGRPEYIPDIFLCAGYDKGGHDSCQGDSGGPLQVKGDDGKWFLAGIISWGIGCGDENLPGVCTRISRFKLWILSTMSGVGAASNFG